MRLLGINAPEVVGESRAAGVEAKVHLMGLLSGADALIAQTFKTDMYGRYLVMLWRRAGGVWRNVSAEMLNAGQAVVYPAPSPALSPSGGTP